MSIGCGAKEASRSESEAVVVEFVERGTAVTLVPGSAGIPGGRRAKVTIERGC